MSKPKAQPDTPETVNKKELWRLCYALNCFRQCSHFAAYCIDNAVDEPHFLYTPLACSMAVIYARSFTTAFGSVSLDDSFSTFTEPKLTYTHKMLMSARNGFYAHNDATNDVHSVTLTFKLEKGKKRPKVGVRVDVVNIVPEDFPGIVTLCEAQERNAFRLIGKIYPKVLPQETILKMLVANKSNYLEFPLVIGEKRPTVSLKEITEGLSLFGNNEPFA